MAGEDLPKSKLAKCDHKHQPTPANFTISISIASLYHRVICLSIESGNKFDINIS